MLQVALARVLDRRRERFLASGIWRCVLGAAPLARLDDKCRALHGLSASSGAIRLPHNRCVLGSFSFPDSLHLREHLEEGRAITDMAAIAPFSAQTYGWMLMCVHFTGTIGFLATYWAVRRLYSAIRVD